MDKKSEYSSYLDTNISSLVKNEKQKYCQDIEAQNQIVEEIVHVYEKNVTGMASIMVCSVFFVLDWPVTSGLSDCQLPKFIIISVFIQCKHFMIWWRNVQIFRSSFVCCHANNVIWKGSKHIYIVSVLILIISFRLFKSQFLRILIVVHVECRVRVVIEIDHQSSKVTSIYSPGWVRERYSRIAASVFDCLNVLLYCLWIVWVLI